MKNWRFFIRLTTTREKMNALPDWAKKTGRENKFLFSLPYIVYSSKKCYTY